MAGCEMETGETQSLTAQAVYAYAGMHVAGEPIDVVLGKFIGDVVDESISPRYIMTGHGFNVDRGVDGVRKSIVVPFYQDDPGLRDGLTPAGEEIMFEILVAVEKVAGEQYGLRFEVLDLLHQSVKIFLVDLLGHGDPGFSEMTGLAEVQVR